MEYTQLLGTEAVQKAGQEMRQAATDISWAARQFNEDVNRLQRIADDFLDRLLAGVGSET